MYTQKWKWDMREPIDKKERLSQPEEVKGQAVRMWPPGPLHLRASMKEKGETAKHWHTYTLSHSHTHTLMHTHPHPLSHTHIILCYICTHTYTFILSYTHTLTHTHSHTHTLSHIHTLSHTHSHSHTHTHTLTITHTLSHTHTHTHSHTHTHTHPSEIFLRKHMVFILKLMASFFLNLNHFFTVFLVKLKH